MKAKKFLAVLVAFGAVIFGQITTSKANETYTVEWTCEACGLVVTTKCAGLSPNLLRYPEEDGYTRCPVIGRNHLWKHRVKD